MRPVLVPLGDSCVSVVFEEKLDPAINARCATMARSLEQYARRGIRDVVPTYNTVSVHFDPMQMNREDLYTELSALVAMEMSSADADFNEVTIPVEYGGAFGPDLPAVAQFGRCSEHDVVRLHSRKVYRVYMLGFLPGFPYMGSVSGQIAMPRLDTPRPRVAAGSVGIAGVQTGIYPCDTPGGWRIIGRTDTRIFDPDRPTPFLLKAGDRVKFVAV